MAHRWRGFGLGVGLLCAAMATQATVATGMPRKSRVNQGKDPKGQNNQNDRSQFLGSKLVGGLLSIRRGAIEAKKLKLKAEDVYGKTLAAVKSPELRDMFRTELGLLPIANQEKAYLVGEMLSILQFNPTKPVVGKRALKSIQAQVRGMVDGLKSELVKTPIIPEVPATAAP